MIIRDFLEKRGYSILRKKKIWEPIIPVTNVIYNLSSV